MDETRLASALSNLFGPELAHDLVKEYVNIRIDYATKTFGRASAGKFVETFVQGSAADRERLPRGQTER